MKSSSVLVCIFLLCYSCTSGITKNEIFQNDKIDSKVRATIAELNKHAYNSLCDNSYGALSQLFSDTLLNRINTDFAQKFMPQIQRVIKGKQFKVFDEFYIKQAKAIDTVNISSGQNDDAYTIKLLNNNNETYISMLVAGDSVDEVMLTLMYVKIGGQWKLNSLLGEDYSLGGKNAVKHYEYAKTLEQKDFLVDAINTMSLAGHCMAPGGKMFRYKKAEEMNRFSDSLSNKTKAKYPIPYKIELIASKPSVVNIHYEVIDHHFTPMIVYQSSILLSDTVSLKKENDGIQKNIGTIFYGMDKNNPAILYRAYNELPQNDNDQKPYYGFIQKFK